MIVLLLSAQCNKQNMWQSEIGCIVFWLMFDASVQNVLHDYSFPTYVVFFVVSLCRMFPTTLGFALRMQMFWCLLVCHQSVINTK